MVRCAEGPHRLSSRVATRPSLRILFLNHNIVRRGGTFYRAYHAARYLVRRGHTVTLLTISAERRWGFRREVSEGVEIIETPDLLWGVGRSGWDLWDAISRVMFLRGRQWDVVHAWDCRPAVILPALYARGQSREVSGKLFIDWGPGKLAWIQYAEPNNTTGKWSTLPV